MNGSASRPGPNHHLLVNTRPPAFLVDYNLRRFSAPSSSEMFVINAILSEKPPATAQDQAPISGYGGQDTQTELAIRPNPPARFQQKIVRTTQTVVLPRRLEQLAAKAEVASGNDRRGRMEVCSQQWRIPFNQT